MDAEILNYPTETGKPRNNSKLAYVDCCMRLMDWHRPFEEMSNDDLDSLYAVAEDERVGHSSARIRV